MHMMPRLSARVHPQSSHKVQTPSSNFEEKVASYTCLPSPSAPFEDTVPPSARGVCGLDRRRTEWLYNYPRLSFVVLFIVCTYIGGIYISTKVTSWALGALGVHSELSAARQVYLATAHALNSMSECVDRSSLQYLAGAKLQFEADSKRVQKIIDANDEVLAAQRNATMTCSSTFLKTLQKQVKTAALGDANSTLSCFSDNFYANVPDTGTLSSSRALVLAVRAMLTTQVVSEAHDNVSEQQKQFETQLFGMWSAVDTVKTSIEKTLGATNTLASKQLSSLAPILSDNDGSGHTQQSASRLGRLSKGVSSKLSGPLTSTSTTGLETIRKAGRTLHKALQVLSGLHDGFSDVMDTVDETWELLEKQLNATVQQAAQLQKELAYAAESTAQQINRTSTAIATSFEQAQDEVTASFSILQQQWQNAAKKLVLAGFTPWQRLGDQLVAELTANQRQSTRTENAIQRRYILPDRTTNSTLGQEKERLAIAARDGLSANTTSSSDSGDEFDIDTAVLRASLVDVGAFITQLIFYVDIGRLTMMVADLAVGLITESYSDMPMLDIRGITTADTIGSICEVFLCKHSISAVCYTLVTKSSELLRVLVTFLLLFFVASIVTAGLFVWKQDHIAHCGSAGVSRLNSSQTAFQSITRAFVENSGNTSNRVVDPLDEIQKYTTIINDSIRNDYAALTLDSAAVWKNQSTAVEDFSDCTTTTSSLVRVFQDCTERGSSGELGLANDASLSSQCLTSSLRSTSELVTPVTSAEQMSSDAPFLVPSSAFASCFPQEELAHLGREEAVGKLQHSLACATEKAVYLSCASWWLLIVVFVANRFTVRMVIKAAGIYWWRFLSADRLQFVAFCREDGDLVATDKLQGAIQEQLREAKWRIAGRFLGIVFSITCAITVILFTFQGIL
ncbi:hypothetical protein PRIC1_013811 [Phytophthora ramorum]